MHPVIRKAALFCVSLFFPLLPFVAFSQSPAAIYELEDAPSLNELKAAEKASSAQLTETDLLSSTSAVAAGKPFWIVAEVTLKKGWHTYWVNPGDSGLAPQLVWTLPRGFTASDIYYLPPERVLIGDLMNYGYHDKAYFPVKITPPALVDPRMNFILSLKMDLLVCETQCVPDSSTVVLSIPASQDGNAPPSEEAQRVQEIVQQAYKQDDVPAIEGKYTLANGEAQFYLPARLSASQRESIKTFLPESAGLISNPAQPTILSDESGVLVSVASDPFAKVEGPISGILMLSEGKKTRALYATLKPTGQPLEGAEGVPASGKDGGMGLLVALLFAFLGGVILNTMPCVFPILSLKALTIAKKAGHADSHTEVRREGIAYTLGVLVSFALLSLLLIFLQQGGEAIGWGYQLQSPSFVLLLTYLLLLVGLNLSGAFELPVLFGQTAMHLEVKAEHKLKGLGSFLAGVLAVLVATPCTAPFMASAIGYALTQSPIHAMLIFEALGLGLAFPYILFAIYPSLASRLPKPGPWMIRFRQFLAYPMYASAAWLLWVLAMQVSSQDLAMALFGLVMLAFAVWLIQVLHSRPQWMRLLAVFVLIFFCLLPFLNFGAEKHEAVSIPFSDAKLEELRAEGKGVLVNATADWCLTCKVNEAVALHGKKFSALLRKYKVTYLVADWTKRDDKITAFLKRHGRSGVPVYVYYPPGGEPVILPQLLTLGIVEGAFKGE